VFAGSNPPFFKRGSNEFCLHLPPRLDKYRYLCFDLIKDDFSLSIWIKTVAEGGFIVLKTTSPPYWLVHLSNGKLRLMLNDGTGPTMVLAGKKVVNDGNWHHLVLTVKSNQSLRFFVDGKMDAESALGKLGDMTKKAAIGIGGYGYASGYFKGSIDSFRLYRGSLSSDEVAKIFNEG